MRVAREREEEEDTSRDRDRDRDRGRSDRDRDDRDSRDSRGGRRGVKPTRVAHKLAHLLRVCLSAVPQLRVLVHCYAIFARGIQRCTEWNDRESRGSGWRDELHGGDRERRDRDRDHDRDRDRGERGGRRFDATPEWMSDDVETDRDFQFGQELDRFAQLRSL